MPYDKLLDPRHREPFRIDLPRNPPRNRSDYTTLYWYCPPPPDDVTRWGAPGNKIEIRCRDGQYRWDVHAWVELHRPEDGGVC